METVISFKFKQKNKPKEKRVVKTKEIRCVSTIITCLCTNVNGTWEAIVEILNDDGCKEKVSMPFTEQSYDLKTKTIVFYKDSKGKCVSVRRNKEHAYAFPGSPDIYSPFCNNWLYTGKIYNIRGKLYFDIIEALRKDNSYS